MKHLAIVILIVLALTFGLTPGATAASPVQATGGGGVNIVGSFLTFSFNALQIDPSSGAAKGHFNFIRNPGAQSFVRGDILYLWVKGNKAWIGFIITNSNDPSYDTGQEIVFEIQDNPDRISDPVFEHAYYATYEQDIFASKPVFDWTNGNIRIK